MIILEIKIDIFFGLIESEQRICLFGLDLSVEFYSIEEKSIGYEVEMYHNENGFF